MTSWTLGNAKNGFSELVRSPRPLTEYLAESPLAKAVAEGLFEYDASGDLFPRDPGGDRDLNIGWAVSVRYLLDTNVLLELVKRRPALSVRRWVAALSRWARTELPTQFVGRLLSVDAAVAVAWGAMSAEAIVDGRPLPIVFLDGLLLATAQVHELTFVTRNLSDYARRGSPAVPVYDPWTGTLH